MTTKQRRQRARPELDSDGNPPTLPAGTLVEVVPLQQCGVVVRQQLHHDCGETFWGNVLVKLANGQMTWANCWQCRPQAQAKE